jgi:hypothetical protein
VGLDLSKNGITDTRNCLLVHKGTKGDTRTFGRSGMLRVAALYMSWSNEAVKRKIILVLSVKHNG